VGQERLASKIGTTIKYYYKLYMHFYINFVISGLRRASGRVAE
jgi:hypothetical protein